MENVGAVKELCKLTVGVHLKVVKINLQNLAQKGIRKKSEHEMHAVEALQVIAEESYQSPITVRQTTDKMDETFASQYLFQVFQVV